MVMCNHAIIFILIEGLRTRVHKPSIYSPPFELKSGLKCVSGHGEHSVNPQNLTFPTRDTTPHFLFIFVKFIAHSGSQPLKHSDQWDKIYDIYKHFVSQAIANTPALVVHAGQKYHLGLL